MCLSLMFTSSTILLHEGILSIAKLCMESAAVLISCTWIQGELQLKAASIYIVRDDFISVTYTS